MILPSDSDLPPDRNEGDSPSEEPDDTTAWWEDGDDDPDINPGGLPEDGDDVDDPNAPQLQSIAGPGWRNDLYKDLLESLRDIEAIEDPDDEFAPPEPPDLFTFFGELAALRQEMRHQGQRSNDGLNQLDKTLAPLLRGTASGKPGKGSVPGALAPAATWPMETCLALVSAWDLLPQAVSSTAFAASLQPLFEAAGLTRISTIGQPFDPVLMTLAGTETAAKKSAKGTVLRETSAGFLRAGSLLRPAAVIVGE